MVKRYGRAITADLPELPGGAFVLAGDYDALAEALTKVHGIVAEYWGPCPGSVETLLTIRDALGATTWRPNVDFMPRLMTENTSAGESK